MNITIKARHTPIPDHTKDYAEKKAEKLEKFYRVKKVEFIMDKEGDSYTVQIAVSPDGGGTALLGYAEGPEWFSAIDEAHDKVERQLLKLKEKVKSHRVKKQWPEPDQGVPEGEEGSSLQGTL